MSSKVWAGEEELQKSLQELCGQGSVSTVKVKHVVTTANKYFSDFKMVVYEIEKFVKKANSEDKLAGIYVIDALCRQHSKEKDVFAKRFSIRLKETFDYLRKLPSKDKVSLRRIYDEWRKKDVFSTDVLNSLRMESSHESSTNEAKVNHSTIETAMETDDFFSSLAAEAQQNEKLTSEKQILKSVRKPAASVEVKKAAKLCPFRDGNCPFSDKCRYNHFETNTLEQYAARYIRPKRKPTLLINNSTYATAHKLMESLLSETPAQWSDIVSMEGNKADSHAQELERLTIPRKRVKYEFIPSAAISQAPPMYEISKQQFTNIITTSSTH